jgi:S1-C subfamily serine protease
LPGSGWRRIIDHVSRLLGVEWGRSVTRAAGAVAVCAVVAATGIAQADSGSDSEHVVAIAGRACVLVRADVAAVQPGEPVLASAGFFVSASGHVLTTYGAIGGFLQKAATDAEGAAPAFPVEVSWASPGDGGLQSQAATVLAVSREADLALLSVTVDADVPHLPIGDSEGLQRPQSVTALGYPGVRRTKDGGHRARPPASRPGRVRAVPGGGGITEAQRIETEAARRLGIGGGPLVDEDGYAVGVVQAASGPSGTGGGAVPINRAKEFLELNGLGSLVPPRLALGSRESFDGKGIRLLVAGARADSWPGRTQLVAGPDGSGVTLRVDRIASRYGLAEVERALLSGEAFGGFPARQWGGEPGRARAGNPGRARLAGSAVEATAESPRAIEYLIFNAEAERVVAHYSGPANVIASNRGALRRSLQSIELTRLILKPVSEPLSFTLEAVRLPADDAPVVSVPAGWTREPVADPLPDGMPAPDAALSSSPKQDFSVAVRTLWWRRAPRTAAAASAAASAVRGPHGVGSYLTDRTELGTAWVTAGRFLSIGDSLLLLELRAPREKARFLDALSEQWLAAGLR